MSPRIAPLLSCIVAFAAIPECLRCAPSTAAAARSEAKESLKGETGQTASSVGEKTSADPTVTLQRLEAGWSKPARTYKSHTRWWWPGNALTPADITWQLEQMAAQGFGGVEIMSAWKMYEKGNHEYLTPEFLALVRHAVKEAKRLDIEVALTFSPGWSFGGPWVAPEDQSRVLCMGEAEVRGGGRFDAPPPYPQFKPDRHHARVGDDPGRLIAVVAARVLSEEAKGKGKKKVSTARLDPSSLTVVAAGEAAKAGAARLSWTAPNDGGRWKLMAFWLKPTGQECQAQNAEPPAMVIDHLNRDAVRRYCEHLGGTFAREIGGEFGLTVDSFFCDSFEIHPLPDTLLWSHDTLERLNGEVGYDFTRYLPSIWHDVGANTPRLRYDLNHFLHKLGLETVYQTFGDWCASHRVQPRIQPHYRFPSELVQSAGAVARPETEVTTARFETVPDPRKATASGARFYGDAILSAESYTFIHPARYRTDLQDLKIATDAFLRDGITQFYNHGYFASPEPHVAPSRDMPWANRISHWNTWWPYYRHFAAYVARSCFLLRQGSLVADVLLYSPQATVWSERTLWGAERRVMPYGDVAKTLVANGYDYDVVNDDLLQNQARIEGASLSINGHARRVLILPRTTIVPLATMRVIAAFARAGGTVIALEAPPSSAAGMRDAAAANREVSALSRELFGPGANRGTMGVFLPDYEIDQKPFSPARQPWAATPPLTEPRKKLLAAIAKTTAPDFQLAGGAQSDGLTFVHKRIGAVDVYFVTNLQPSRIATEIAFRIPAGRRLERWDAISGERRLVASAAQTSTTAAGAHTSLSVDFAPWESAFFVFAPSTATSSATPSPFGNAAASLATVGSVAAFAVDGPWDLHLEGHGFETLTARATRLSNWSDDARTRHFSGTGVYRSTLDMTPELLARKGRIVLDLGRVGTIAEVEINGKSAGVAWMAPHRFDVTGALNAGKNEIVVRVTNTLIHHVTGLKEPPDVPAFLQPRLGKANPSIYPESKLAYREMAEKELPPAGLMGPVRLEWIGAEGNVAR